MDPHPHGRLQKPKRLVPRAVLIQEILTRIEQELKAPTVEEREKEQREKFAFERELEYLEDEENRRFLALGRADEGILERIRVLHEQRKQRGDEVAKALRRRWKALNWVKAQILDSAGQENLRGLGQSGGLLEIPQVPLGVQQMPLEVQHMPQKAVQVPQQTPSVVERLPRAHVSQRIAPTPYTVQLPQGQDSLFSQWNKLLQLCERQNTVQAPPTLNPQNTPTTPLYPRTQRQQLMRELKAILGGRKGLEFVLWLREQGDHAVGLCKFLSHSEEGQLLSGKILQILDSPGVKGPQVFSQQKPAQTLNTSTREEQLIEQLKQAIDTGDRQVVISMLREKEAVAIDLCQLLASTDEGRLLFAKLMEVLDRSGEEGQQVPVFFWPEVDEQLRSAQQSLQVYQRPAQRVVGGGLGSNQANQNLNTMFVPSVPRATPWNWPTQLYQPPTQNCVPPSLAANLGPMTNGVLGKRVHDSITNQSIGVEISLDEEYCVVLPPEKRLRRRRHLDVRVDR